jgi:hypothetical protein
MLFKRRSRLAGISVTRCASFGTKEKTFAPKKALTAISPAYCRMLHRAIIVLVRLNLLQSLYFVLLVYLSQLISSLVVPVWNRSLRMYALVALRTSWRWHVVWFAADRTLLSDRIHTFRYILPPVFDARYHILSSNSTPFKVGLKCNGRSKRCFVGVCQTSVPISTTAHLTKPFIAPPASTVTEHSIPERTIALTAMPGYNATVQRPAATQVVQRSRPYVLESKSSTIKWMSDDRVAIPAPTTTVRVRKTNSRLVHLDTISIDPKISTCAVLLSEPTACLVASKIAADEANGLG